ncbi:hypothetical protein [Aquabacter cavernae]|uniref:hypothetical protein n=1 Tax=Aquabacter cavernae TaxID=2496029 RepID=UPI000F8D8108|nr:hypothetical protein [Aquabacter cavernae]
MPAPTNARGGTQDWKTPSSPHGYDLCEFDPRQSARDERRMRTHEPDEERLRLRRAQAALDTKLPGPAQDVPPGADDEENDEVSGTSRLYRD